MSFAMPRSKIKQGLLFTIPKLWQMLHLKNSKRLVKVILGPRGVVVMIGPTAICVQCCLRYVVPARLPGTYLYQGGLQWPTSVPCHQGNRRRSARTPLYIGPTSIFLAQYQVPGTRYCVWYDSNKANPMSSMKVLGDSRNPDFSECFLSRLLSLD